MGRGNPGMVRGRHPFCLELRNDPLSHETDKGNKKLRSHRSNGITLANMAIAANSLIQFYRSEISDVDSRLARHVGYETCLLVVPVQAGSAVRT